MRISAIFQLGVVALWITACDSSNEGDSGDADGSEEKTSESDADDDDESSGDDSTDEDDSETDSGDTDTNNSSQLDPTAHAPCPVDKRVGRITVELKNSTKGPFTNVQGSVSNGVVPSRIPEFLDESGSCKMFHQRVLSCDPPCGTGETCGLEGACIPEPRDQSVGTIAIDGMTADIEMEPTGATNFYLFRGDIPHPGVSSGSAVQLDATGGDYAPFSIAAYGIDEMTGTGDSAKAEREKDLTVKWDAAKVAEQSMVELRLNVNNHGGAGSWVECVVPDTGSFDIPAKLVTALIDAGLSGFPSLDVARQSAGFAESDLGCVDLFVLSSATLEVEVPGLISCSDDEDCPDGQECLPDLTCGDPP